MVHNCSSPADVSETHPQVVDMMKQLREEKEKKLTMLREWRENQIQGIEDAAYAERKECEEEYEVGDCVRFSLILFFSPFTTHTFFALCSDF